MLKLLLKKQLLEIFQVYFYDAKKNRARSKTSTAMYFVLFILLVFGLLGGIFTFLATKLCTPLIAVGIDWLYFALMGLIAVLWKGSELFSVMDAMFAETAGSVPLLLCVVLCGFASMNFMIAPSVSLEGKSLWLLQSLPVEPWRIFRAKIRMQLLLTGLPLLLCIMCTAAVYPMHSTQLLMLLLFAGSYALLMALAGLFFGVKMPTLTWTNEIMPIKQGAPVMIILFGGFGYMVLLFAGFMLLPGWMLGFCGYMSCFVGVNLFLSVWVCLWLREKGVVRFSEL